ncbi:putative glycosyltransferase EpsF [Planctomycetes bacterium CA13]|uniref:Putative glycosyltransferase EpsF n=1 Tax=Novipirellula herctigrandis TaxID=2527986 RepID=A0A5C5ZD27_9BACT|nr:putative glycosyltransferase EpsF [Planctomycetes bacterium CA13]
MFKKLPSRSDRKPLRCLFVITSMPVGGAETLLVNLMRRMDPAVMVPEVACLKEAGPLGEQIADEFSLHTDLLSGKYDLRILPRLIRLMRKRQIDVVVTVGAGDKMFWGRMAAKLAGVPVIASALHSTGWPDGVGRLNRTLTRVTDAFIAVADSHGEFLRDFEHFPAEKVHVIRNGIDCDRFKPNDQARSTLLSELGLAPDTAIIGIVAALRSEKNHEMFVRAAGKTSQRNPNAHWVIIGDGPERSTIERVRDELNLNDRVHLLGTRHDTPELVAAMDVFALSSLNEASPVSILEALACGVPVVATDVGSVSESVVNGETGYLVPSKDVDAMAEVISRLLECTDQAKRMGKQGRERVLETGSLTAMVRGYETLATDLYDAKVEACLAKNPATTRQSELTMFAGQGSRPLPLRKTSLGK